MALTRGTARPDAVVVGRARRHLAAALLLAAGAVLSVSPAFAQPAAPTGFEVAQAGSIKAKLAWNAPAAGAGIVRHEVRLRGGSAAFPDTWTPIPSSRPGQANAAGYLLDGLTAETDYDFELRAVSGDGPGAAASASATTLVPFTASFSPLKTYYEGTSVTLTIVFTAAIDKPTLERGVLVQNGRIAVREEPGQPETWHISATSTRRRDVTFFLRVTTAAQCGAFGNLCSTLGEPLTAALTGTVPHVPSVTLALSLATISEDSGMTTVTALLDKTWHEDVTVAVSAAPVTPATASDFDLSSTTTLTIAADDMASTGAVTVTAVDNDAQAANRQVTVSGEVTAPDYVPDPDAVTLTIRDDEAAAPAPTGFAVSAGSTKAELSWDQTPKGVVVTAHEVRYRAGDDAFPADWTAIADSAPGEANATGHTVTALSPGTDYDFELRVVNDNGSSSAATASATTQAAFTARFETIPDTHDRTPFTVRIGFSAAIASTGVLEQGVQLTGGDNTDVTAVGGDDDLFDYEVTPSGVGAVTITLPVASGCGSNGAICNTFDEPLSAELTGTVAFFGVPPSGKLVGNVTKTLDTGTLPTSPETTFVYAQSFTTGANGAGYKLDRIGIHLTQVDPGDLAAVSLLSADADGEPDAELYPLTGPLALQNGAMNYFSAPPGALLTKETTYYLQVTGAGRSEFRVRIVGGTDETEEDADSAADWLVGDDLRERRSTTDWITTPKVMKIRVDGHVLGTFPTVFLGLAPPAVAESGATTVTAAALPASDTAFTVTVSASPVSPATSSDFSLSANATLDFDANETASTGTVTLTAADDTAETADREVTVSGSVSATGIAGPDDVTLTILDDDAELFTAEFSEIPETHDGQTAFTVKIRFSADIASAETLADGVELTGGAAGSITRVGSGEDHWNYPVTPAGDDDVYITLPVPSGCAGTGDICSADDVRLATALVGRVAGPVSQDPPDGGDPPDDGTPTAPAAPTGFGVDSLDGAVRLLWRAPLSDGGSEITHHQYRERIDNPSQFGDQWQGWSNWKTIPDSTPGGQNGESFTVTELKNDRLYQFELRAVNAIGSTRSQPRREGGFPDAGELPTDLSLTPSPPDPAPAVFSRAEYTVKFTGAWTLAVTPDGLPSDAHFSRLVGGVHNGDVVFLTDTGPASPGVESMAEQGNTTLLKAEIKAAGDDRLSVLEGTKVTIGPTASESFTEVALTTDHPRVTLVTMIAPTPDWFVGVSGLSMLDSLGGWRAARTVYLHPFDAGTEDGAGFSLSNAATDPPVYIASLVGKGKFSAEPIATLTFTRTSVASAPAAPADLAATPGDASVALAWTTGADGGSAIRMHQYRYRTGAAYPAAWTDIPDSAAGGANVSGFTVGGLTNGASHSFQVRARNDIGAGPAATSGAATPMPTVVVNAAPAFDSAATFSPAENQTTAGTVVASDNDTGDAVTGYEITGGADQSFFSIGSTSGLLTFNSAPNFEAPSDTNADGSYLVTVQATSGTDSRVKTAMQSITVTVTDVSGEKPAAPAAPTVSAASVTSLNVNWSAPANAGPAITDYDVQYRAGTSGGWTDGGHSGTATTATITGLAQGTSHQVQVRATNAEGTGDWSVSGAGSTYANEAEAQEIALVSNIREAPSGEAAATPKNFTGGQESRVAQRFTTGPSTGYGLQSVLLNLTESEGQGGSQVKVGIHRNKDSGNPGRELVVLDNPDAVFGTNRPFSATSPFSLDAGTSYWVVVSNTGSTSSRFFVSVTASGNETTTQEFEIGDSRNAGKPGSWTDISGEPARMEIRGTVPAENNPTLSGLSLGAGVLNPVFASGTTVYTASVRNAVDAVTVTPTKAAASATIEYLNESDMPLTGTSTEAGHRVALAVGNTVIKVKVTAADGSTTQTYTVTMTRDAAIPGICSLNTGDLWCGVVTVGEAKYPFGSSLEITEGYGFTDGDFRAYDAGMLSDTTFALGLNEYTITRILVGAGNSLETLMFGLAGTGGLPDADIANLELHAGASSFAFSTATYVDAQDANLYAWSDSGLSWSVDDTVTLRLRRTAGPDMPTNNAPVFAATTATRTVPENSTAGTNVGDPVTATDDAGDTLEYSLEGTDATSFAVDSASGQITTIANVDYNHEATKNSYSVTVKASDGTDSATIAVTINVTDVAGEAPATPAAPTVSAASVSSLTVNWSAPANAGPAITDYDVQYREGTSGSWSDGNHTGAAITATLSSLSENTSHQVQVRATNDEGTGSWSDSGTGTTDANAAPAFSSSATFDAAENQTAAGTVLATDGDTGDDITGYAITGGADQTFFSIGATSGALTFEAAPNFEDAKDSDTNNDYVVEVQATSGAGTREKTATQTITVTVTDVSGEAPGKPAAPTVAAASVTSLTVTWTKPTNAGPAIDDYDVQYRAGTTGDWSDGGHTGAATTATLSGLSENTSHQVQVRATNDEGTGDWSDSGSGTTDANAAPAFSSSATFDAAENGTEVTMVRAEDSDSEDKIERYDITGGADQAFFLVIASSGHLEFRDAPNFEDAQDQGTNNTYMVEVQATSGTGTREKTATQTITVTVTDVAGEAPGKPAAPDVSAASVTSLTVNWSAPANAGPAITDYDVRYREGTTGDWSDGNHTGAATTATLSSLSENTSYQVQVRATNDEGTGDWSDSGSGTTDANAAPAFSSSATFDAAENGTEVTMVRAEDSDSEDKIERYDITGGADQAFFLVIASSGHLEFRDAPNFEDAQDQGTNNTYMVAVQATSGTGTREKTATQTITVTVTDVAGEAPGKPAAPDVSAASVTSLTVSWSAPANAGPAITDYDVRYRAGTTGDWSDGNHTGAATTATLSGLSENTSHQVQVRATNDEGTGDWSDSGSGTTDANAAPAFSSSATFDAAENGTEVTMVRAEDSDSKDKIERYDITGGADQAFFLVIASSGHLEFRDAPNFEDAQDQGTNNTYMVAVQATSGTGTREKTATQTITVTVTDVAGEKPAAPPAPSVSSASVTSLNVTWAAPENAGPAITDYDYRHRTTSPVGNWTEITNTTITGLSATIGSLAENTSYDVQVRATNGEGTGDWSPSRTGSTDVGPPLDTPALDVAMVDADALELRFDRPLDESSVPAPEDFTVVLDDGAGRSAAGVGRYAGSGARGRPLAASAVGVRGTERLRVTAVEVRGAVVVLTLEREVPHGTRATVSYTPGAAPLRDRQGMAVPPISSESVVETALSVVDAEAVEGDAVRFPVRLSRAVASAVTVDWALMPGSAAPGTDYTGPLAGSLTIEGGETAGVIAVPTAEDAAVESTETFTLTLTEPADFPHWALLKTATATGTIRDDDGGGTGGTSGSGSGGGGANRPPVVERDIDDRTLTVGEVLELDVRLNFYDRDQRALDYSVASADASVATVEVDRNGVLTIRGVSRGVTAITVTVADRRDERASDTFLVAVKGPALVALLPRASDPVREGFVRVINHDAEAGEVSIEAVDDTGVRLGPITLSVDAGATVHFNSGDLEDGNAEKGLPEGVGPGEGDWRLVLDSDLDFEVLAYVRTQDGFLTSMHDVAPMRDGRYRVAIFNPGSNPNQVSRLRLVNPGAEDAQVTVTGIDDAGASPGTTVGFDLPAGRSTTLTATELESGVGVAGALGDGVGKWRLTVTATGPVVAMSLLSSPTGHLTNLSTVPRTPDDEHGVHVAPLFPSASDPRGRQGFVRVVNRAEASGTVSIEAFDDSDLSYPPVTLALDAKQTRHFNSDDLELGNAEKGLAGSTGTGVGDWRLVLSSDLDIEVLAYIRAADGFLTSMHEVAPVLLGKRRVAIFNPGSNPNQVSRLRLVNPGAEDAQVTITGIDDAGASPGAPVTVTVPAGASRSLAAADLEAGADGFAGALGDGVGKWRLAVTSAQPVIVMSLLSSPTGHLTNLSSAPDRSGN